MNKQGNGKGNKNNLGVTKVFLFPFVCEGYNVFIFMSTLPKKKKKVMTRTYRYKVLGGQMFLNLDINYPNIGWLFFYMTTEETTVNFGELNAR